MDKERFSKQLAFILEADKEKNILRQTHLSGHGRRENDAEHAWHMAVMIYLLKEYANEEIDVAKAMMMALVHDIVEIDAGDTYAYDANGLATQKEREQQAAERIFGLLPEDQKKEIRGLFEEFEAWETPEARFVHAMDNFQPLLLNHSNDGGDWREHGVSISQVMGRQKKTALGSEEIWEYTRTLLDENVRKGNISLLSDRYTARFLHEEDIPAIYNLYVGNPMYFEYCPPAPTFDGIRSDMLALPPGKDYNDKYYMGFFDGECLIAIMDLVLKYKDNDSAFIGLFMVDKSVQKQGVGSDIITRVCDRLRKEGYSHVRLGFAKGDPQSESFWLKNGFEKTGVEIPSEGYVIVMMQKALG